MSNKRMVFEVEKIKNGYVVVENIYNDDSDWNDSVTIKFAFTTLEEVDDYIDGSLADNFKEENNG